MLPDAAATVKPVDWTVEFTRPPCWLLNKFELEVMYAYLILAKLGEDNSSCTKLLPVAAKVPIGIVVEVAAYALTVETPLNW